MKLKLIVDGGAMQAGPAIAQQIGPLGINMGKVISDINEATLGFKGIKVPVELDIDSKSKKYDIKVFSPPVAELLKKELSLEKGSGEALKTKVGNIALERIIYIAQTKMPSLLAKDLKSAIKLVVGTCVSMGILVDNKEAKEIEKDIDEGKYSREIKEVLTEVSAEKKKSISEFFVQRKAMQEKVKKAAEEAAAAAEAAKVAAATAAGTTPVAGTTPGATAEAGKTPATATASAKPEAGKKEDKKPGKK